MLLLAAPVKVATGAGAVVLASGAIQVELLLTTSGAAAEETA